MKSSILKKTFLCVCMCVVSCIAVNAQIKYNAEGKLTMGPTTPFQFYHQTIHGNGVYLQAKSTNFFQIDVTAAATRLASHYNQVVFYNTQTGVYNSIQVNAVYNYSDARAKRNIQTSSYGMSVLKKLRPVTYNFADNNMRATPFSRGSEQEIGLLAQEVEQVLPNIVLTDDEGKKLINYTALIPVLIEGIKSLQTEIDVLKAQVKLLKK